MVATRRGDARPSIARVPRRSSETSPFERPFGQPPDSQVVGEPGSTFTVVVREHTPAARLYRHAARPHGRQRGAQGAPHTLSRTTWISSLHLCRTTLAKPAWM